MLYFLSIPINFKMKKFAWVLMVLFCTFNSYAQSPQWAISSGSPLHDVGNICRTAPNGNVYVAGSFSGTIDLDPSSATYSITSNGEEDAFVACYTSSGSFLWGFGIGGNSYDAVMDMTIDNNNNLILAGFFRGQNVDFDPSSANAFFSDKGYWAGGNFGGDGFVAKYSSSGTYQWAIDLGSEFNDNVEAIGVDEQGYIYAGGGFKDTVNIDPYGVYMLNSNFNYGGACLIKYTPSGHLVWGFNFGEPGIAGIDNAVRGLQVKNGYVYLTGFFEGQGVDFDPSSATAYLSCSGFDDMYLSKYDTAGHYQFALNIGGSNLEDAADIRLDNADNIYISGQTSSATVNFPGNPTPVTAPGGGGSADILLAKYSSAGQFIWQRLLGSPGIDYGNEISIRGNYLYCTGVFRNTVDFDPSSATANLTSNGDGDIYMCKYDLNGNYLCGFNVGSAAYDEGRGMAIDTGGYLYLTGEFSGNNVDFDPTPATLALNGNGNGDIFLVRYNWSDTGMVNGYLTGDTVCGQQAYLTFTATSGTSPFTLTYTDGTTTYVQSNVQSGVPFLLNPQPQATKTYILTNIVSTDICNQQSVNDSVVVKVEPPISVDAGTDTTVCTTSPYKLNGSASGNNLSFSWSPVTALNNSTSLTPTVTVTDTTIKFYLTVTDTNGCTSVDSVTLAIDTIPHAIAVPDTLVCRKSYVQLTGSGGNTYSWLPAGGLNNANIANPVAYVLDTSVYSLIVSNHYGCKDTASVTVNVLPAVVVNAGADTSVCPGQSFVLHATGSPTYGYSWYPANGLNSPLTDTTTVIIDTTATFYVAATDSFGCSDTDNIKVSVIPFPVFTISPQIVNICSNDSAVLTVSGDGNYLWSPATSVSDNTSAHPTVFPKDSTIFYVVCTDKACGRDTTMSATVNVYHAPDVKITQVLDVDCAHMEGQLFATGAQKYQWFPADKLDDANAATPHAVPDTSTLYTVIGTNAYGCSNTDTATLHVFSSGTGRLFAPTAFTPNGDGKNDCFSVNIPGVVSNYKLMICNRWGQIVFESYSYGDCWNGTLGGVPQPIGTYFYYYKGNSSSCGSVKGKGDITLIR